MDIKKVIAVGISGLVIGTGIGFMADTPDTIIQEKVINNTIVKEIKGDTIIETIYEDKLVMFL